jgi:hypothetical protein
MLTTEEAAALLAERGVMVRQRSHEHPPTARNIEHWCKAGVLTCERKGGPRRGVWLVAEEALEDFEPPTMGRKPGRTPRATTG